MNLLSAAPFAFLPVLVGFSATKVFGGNPYLGLTMGAAMVSPALMNGYNVAASLAGAEGTDPMKYWNLFGLQVQQAGYQGTVLPIMLVAFILSHIEKFFHKVLKGTIDFIFTPTLTILITGFLTFLLGGPPMFQLGTWLGEGINWLYTVAGPLGGLLFGTFYAFIVMTGMHQAFPPIEMSLWATGGSFIFVVASMSNTDHQEQEDQGRRFCSCTLRVPGHYRARNVRCEPRSALALLHCNRFRGYWFDGYLYSWN